MTDTSDGSVLNLEQKLHHEDKTCIISILLVIKTTTEEPPPSVLSLSFHGVNGGNLKLSPSEDKMVVTQRETGTNTMWPWYRASAPSSTADYLTFEIQIKEEPCELTFSFHFFSLWPESTCSTGQTSSGEQLLDECLIQRNQTHFTIFIIILNPNNRQTNAVIINYYRI